MERYCGALQPAIRSRRFPYSSLNRFVLDNARLTHIKVIYDLHEALSLRGHHEDKSTSILGCTLHCSDCLVKWQPPQADHSHGYR